MAKIAIIGGSGYLGTRLIAGLLQRGYHTDDIVNVDVVAPAATSLVEHRACDILDQHAIVAVLHGALVLGI
jgi:nucleoside-diphosphate-sugar epimerase